MRTLLVNCRLVTPQPARYQRMNRISVNEIDDGAVLIEDGVITIVGSWREMREQLSERSITEGDVQFLIDCEGRALLPGFVDSHTHLVYAGSRVHEFIRRIQGATYLQIAKEGGGIAYTVRETRKATKEELLELALKRAEMAVRAGTVAMETKTGYHLSLEGEGLALEVIDEMASKLPIDVVPTLLAHIVPPGEDRERYLKSFLDEMLPAFKGRAKFVDVFCDVGAFTLHETEAILRRAKELGYQLKVHANEFESLGAVQLAVELGARSVDHLLNLSEDELKLLANSETVATLMPATSFFINEPYAPAKELAERGAIISLATDYNAGSSQTLSMSFVASLATLKLKLIPEQVLVAMTINGAYAAGLEGKYGAIAEGYVGSVVLLSASDWRELMFSPGNDLIEEVVIKGFPQRRASEVLSLTL